MTLSQLFMWHREQAERFAWLADNHKTTGGAVHRAAVTRRNQKLAAFHAEAASMLKLMMHTTGVLEQAAAIADTFTCGTCGMDGKCATAIRALKERQ
ncbi:hypothetical protein [Paraburkholderia sp. D1E]|uniref:hypothetical protein n=1 Tax=Paraburkholderia sp. D1E TaxID=3461398 RepID=UPI00404667FD